MDENHILAQFCLLTGLTQEQAQEYSGLLSSARRQVEKQLNPQADPTSAQETLEQLAAAIAWQGYLNQTGSGGGFKRISTQDLTVEWQDEASTQQQSAQQLVDSLRQSLADLLENGFAFLLT